MIRAVARHVAILWGWQRLLVAALSGAVGALAMPPFGFIPAMAVSLTLAVWLIDGATGERGRVLPSLRAAFTAGWWWGFGYFLAGLWWVGAAFLVDADQFEWLMPLAVLGLPALLAFFPAAAFALARCLWPRNAARLFSLAAMLAIMEWLRGHLFTGFPWNAFGYALAGEIHLAQILALVGLPSLTLLAVLILASPALLADEPAARWSRRLPVVAVIALVAMAGLGALRLSAHPTEMAKGIRLRIMQPSIPQDDKFEPAMRDEIMRRYIELSQRASGPDSHGLDDVTHLIWPESAFPFIVSRDADALAQIAAMLPPEAVLITGAGRAEDAPDLEEGVRYYNSVQIIDSSGAVLDSYDKVHLVPFGEYLPYQSFLESLGLEQLTRQRGGFAAGDRLRTIEIPNAAKAGILVCYEAIFPGQVLDPQDRPSWLINVTNDAWFGTTPGPYQHLLAARSRAIEEGLPLVRAANSGISAVVDPVGRTVAALPLGTTGVLDSNLPLPLEVTTYGRIGDLILVMILIPALLIPAVARLRS